MRDHFEGSNFSPMHSITARGVWQYFKLAYLRNHILFNHSEHMLFFRIQRPFFLLGFDAKGARWEAFSWVQTFLSKRNQTEFHVFIQNLMSCALVRNSKHMVHLIWTTILCIQA